MNPDRGFSAMSEEEKIYKKIYVVSVALPAIQKTQLRHVVW